MYFAMHFCTANVFSLSQISNTLTREYTSIIEIMLKRDWIFFALSSKFKSSPINSSVQIKSSFVASISTISFMLFAHQEAFPYPGINNPLALSTPYLRTASFMAFALFLRHEAINLRAAPSLMIAPSAR